MIGFIRAKGKVWFEESLYEENVGDCGTEGGKGGGKERKKRRKRAEKSGTCYFDASSFFLRNTQNIGISDYS